MQTTDSRTASTENLKSMTRDERARVIKDLAGFYAVMGNMPEVEGSLTAMAEVLLLEASHDNIKIALDRCMRECRWPVRLPDIFLRIPGCEVTKPDAEARCAWDILTSFVKKYVGNDIHGDYGPEHGWFPTGFPKLEQRILDTVRRTGGWKVYALMDETDFPHQQKRFFEEYRAWTAVEAHGALLALPSVGFHPDSFSLASPIVGETRELPAPKEKPMTQILAPPVKKFAEPMNDADLKARRTKLKKQAQHVQKQFTRR